MAKKRALLLRIPLLPGTAYDVAFNHIYQSIQPFVGRLYLLIMNLRNGKESL
jgi:hypothetical protein